MFFFFSLKFSLLTSLTSVLGTGFTSKNNSIKAFAWCHPHASNKTAASPSMVDSLTNFQAVHAKINCPLWFRKQILACCSFNFKETSINIALNPSPSLPSSTVGWCQRTPTSREWMMFCQVEKPYGFKEHLRKYLCLHPSKNSQIQCMTFYH